MNFLRAISQLCPNQLTKPLHILEEGGILQADLPKPPCLFPRPEMEDHHISILCLTGLTSLEFLL